MIRPYGYRDRLYDLLPGDYGARGEFDDRSCDYSVQAWTNRYRGWLALGLSLRSVILSLLCGQKVGMKSTALVFNHVNDVLRYQYSL